jgi:hypothetical protein
MQASTALPAPGVADVQQLDPIGQGLHLRCAKVHTGKRPKQHGNQRNRHDHELRARQQTNLTKKNTLCTAPRLLQSIMKVFSKAQQAAGTHLQQGVGVALHQTRPSVGQAPTLRPHIGPRGVARHQVAARDCQWGALGRIGRWLRVT